MLIPPDRLEEVYKYLRTATTTNRPINIFASLDCDSVCATKILTSICMRNGLRYTFSPVRGYQDLEIKLKEIRNMIAEGELDNLIFINCLATENVIRKVFQVDINENDVPNLRIFVFDYHKPVHLTNIYSKKLVWIVESEESCGLQYPKPFIEEESDEESSEESEESSQEEDGGPPRKRRKLNPKNADELAERHQLKRSNETHYKDTYFGKSSSWFLYLMSTKSNQDDNLMLWCSIIGTTTMFVNQRMDRNHYNELVEEYQNFCLRKNNPFRELSGSELSEERKRRPRDHVQFSHEFQLVMLHHWTIYNSLFYSPVVASKLGLWKEKGNERIDYLLARMALPKKEAQQEWESIEEKLQKEFYSRFEKHALQELGDDIKFPSFTKQHGEFDNLRASDVVYSLSALLEDETRVREALLSDEGESAIYTCVEDSFKESMDALDVVNQHLLKKGFRHARKLQKGIANKALEILNKGRVKSCGIFRYAQIDEKNEFYTPLSLTKLTIFIQNLWTERMKSNNRAEKPLVCGAWNDQSNTYVVCGLPKSLKRQEHNKNPFGTSFRKAAQTFEARVRNVTFDTYLMEIQKDHWPKFVDELHAAMIDHLN